MTQGWFKRLRRRITRDPGCNTHTLWNDEAVCSVCGAIFKSRL